MPTSHPGLRRISGGSLRSNASGLQKSLHAGGFSELGGGKDNPLPPTEPSPKSQETGPCDTDGHAVPWVRLHRSAPVPSSAAGCPGSPGSRHHGSDTSTGPSGWALTRAPPAPGTKLSHYTPGSSCSCVVLPGTLLLPACPSLGTDQFGKRHPCFEKSAFC